MDVSGNSKIWNLCSQHQRKIHNKVWNVTPFLLILCHSYASIYLISSLWSILNILLFSIPSYIDSTTVVLVLSILIFFILITLYIYSKCYIHSLLWFMYILLILLAMCFIIIIYRSYILDSREMATHNYNTYIFPFFLIIDSF